MTMPSHPCRPQILGLPDGYLEANGFEGHTILEIPLSRSQTSEHSLQEEIRYQRCGYGTATGDPGRQGIV